MAAVPSTATSAPATAPARRTATPARRTAVGSPADPAPGGVSYAPPRPGRETTAVSADGARLSVEVHGEDSGPAVVLAHGWTCSTAFWAPVIRRLTAYGLRVVAYDQRGHGRTGGAAPDAYGPAVLADDLCAVLDTVLHPGERAVVGGHSMGAMTLVAAAGRRQLADRAAAWMLCGTGVRRLAAQARVVPLRSPRLRTRAQRLLLRSRAPSPPAASLRKALAHGTLGPAATGEQADVVARLVRACPRSVRARWGAVLDGLDMAAKVGELTVPTVVVAGTADRLTPLAHAHEIAEALPGCRAVHEWPGIGHMAPLERPEAVGDVLRGLAADHLGGPTGEPAADTTEEASAEASAEAQRVTTVEGEETP